MKPENISIRIVSKRKEAGAAQPRPGETIIHVDRTNPILGNRHILASGRHNDFAERMRVINAHEVDFNADVARHGPMSQALDEIVEKIKQGEKIALMCWCSPRPCHGDTYKKEIMRRLSPFCDAA